MNRAFLFAACAFAGLARLPAAEPAKTTRKTYQVPYRLTDSVHVLLRAKIKGRGPFNFILDTGAPTLFVSKAAARKVGVQPDDRGWGVFDRLEIEGGVVNTKVRGRIEDPFQLEGMNGLGLAGVRLDGIIGYSLLARYRIEFDFTRDKMAWTRLDFEPPAPRGLQGKSGTPELEAMGSLMKLAGLFLGKKAGQDVALRGLLGVELADREGTVEVRSVLSGSPAAAAGLRMGDVIIRFQGTAVRSRADVERLAGKTRAGGDVRFRLRRGDRTEDIAFKAGEGF